MSSSYKTSVGAFISMFVIIGLIAFFGYKLSNLIYKRDATYTKKGLFKDLDKGEIEDLDLFEMRQQGFDFAFNLANPNNPSTFTLDPSIGRLTIN